MDPSETRRVLYQTNLRNSASCWLLFYEQNAFYFVLNVALFQNFVAVLSVLSTYELLIFFCASAEIEEEKERESFYSFLTQQKKAQEKRVSAAAAEQTSAK